ncbi:MAG TPA: PilZ domain-containing protein [Blastocatellia bacterium]|nr:PilZ domain-containing protein [Blastocatellia bacterium]
MRDESELLHTGDLVNSGALARTSGLLDKKSKSKRRASTAKLINAHYIEIEYLLNRIESSTTHYQTLGVDRTATSEEIILAYHDAVSILHHPYYKVRAAVPDEMLARIDRAFGKVSVAFSVLTNNGQRVDYDRSLHRNICAPPVVAPKPAEINATSPFNAADVEKKSANAKMAAQEIAMAEQPVFWKAAPDSPGANRRRCERFKLVVPALVAGYERNGGKWQEVAKTIDVSRMGVAVRMKRRLRVGLVLHVTLPLPTKLRSHGFSDVGYNMYAIVRRVEPIKDGLRVVGLEFIGKNPPNGFLHNPSAVFRTEEWNGPDRRREPRFDFSEQVVIEYLDESEQMIRREVTATENVSRSGARVIVQAAPVDFEMVRLISHRHNFKSLAAVRNQYVGKDNVERLCLQFLESKWPV